MMCDNGYMDIQYTEIIKDLLVAIRGKRSQAKLNDLLGYDYNQVSRWETGARRIHWDDFLRICDVCNVKLIEAIESQFAFTIDLNESSASIISLLTSNLKQQEIAKVVETSRYTISRWLKGETTPYLEHILKLLEFHSEMSLVLDLTVGVEKLPSLQLSMVEKMQNTEAFNENLNITKVLACFELSQYKELDSHIPGFISNLVGVALSEENETIELAEKLGMIKLELGKYVLTNDKTMNLAFNPKRSMKIKKIAAMKAVGVMDNFLDDIKVSRNNRLTYQFTTISKDALVQVNEEISKFHNSINTILMSDNKPHDNLLSLSVNLVDELEVLEKKNNTEKTQ